MESLGNLFNSEHRITRSNILTSQAHCFFIFHKNKFEAESKNNLLVEYYSVVQRQSQICPILSEFHCKAISDTSFCTTRNKFRHFCYTQHFDTDSGPFILNVLSKVITNSHVGSLRQTQLLSVVE